MLMQITSFVLEVVFGLLAGSCLLRLFMQRVRVPFGNPAGRFVMAVSNWIVLPLRRVLPSVAGWDSSSLLAAWLLALLHQALLVGLLQALGGVGTGFSLAALLVLAGFELLRLALNGLFALLLVSAILSWVPNRSPISDVVDHLCTPLLRPLRRIVPLVGGIDLSPLVALVLVQIAQMLLGQVQWTLLHQL
jgi:YggT family protein